MRNIILIGMPGAGKSTIGVLLAKSMLMDFADTDLSIQKKYSVALCEIIREYGINEFLKIENDVIRKCEFHNCVIATGGSAVYGEEAMESLKSSGTAVYLNVEPSELEKRINNIHTRGIAMKDGTTIAELYAERAPLYEKYADITVNCTNLTPEQCVDEIMKNI
ncbi:MAG: shikimate kinase [Clostridia bacterium]|nr:shikimate kinase [Clostridia bacterium]MBQ4626213.1 shikimate kinase [Clostridia bacterium]